MKGPGGEEVREVEKRVGGTLPVRARLDARYPDAAPLMARACIGLNLCAHVADSGLGYQSVRLKLYLVVVAAGTAEMIGCFPTARGWDTFLARPKRAQERNKTAPKHRAGKGYLWTVPTGSGWNYFHCRCGKVLLTTDRMVSCHSQNPKKHLRNRTSK